jgi:hypothetical protein
MEIVQFLFDNFWKTIGFILAIGIFISMVVEGFQKDK